MASIPQGSSAQPSAISTGNNTIPLIIITILFFMWGLLTSMNDVLIPHLKSVYTLSYTQAMLVQFCFFGAYFVISLPAGALIKKLGYQNGAVAGLIIAASGCALFYPAATSGYALFLFALFVLASGITILQVAANPYVTVLGPARTASSRLTLTQAFNSLGTTIAPWLGGILILGGAVLTADQLALLPAAEVAAYKAKEAATVQGPYLALAAALLGLALFFAFAKLPKIQHDDEPSISGDMASNKESALSHTHLVLGAIGIFLYVGAEVAIGSLLINFFGEENIAGLKEADAAHLVSYYWGGAMIGRFIGFAVMRYVSPGKTLAFNCACAVLLVLTATFTDGKLAMWAIIAVGLFNSIMFPTIFSMALNNLGKFTGQGSGFLCMAIVGGAIVPLIQGALADTFGLQISFLLPAACYLFIMYFGIKYAGMYKTAPSSEPAHL
ncbi:L-fucose:H+ symporter permease [Cellvibrio sp. pealriver]|uniref:L-fucose:H+ symporter permease n=1 Tax=Cellvibrio sp. pealriver TaxID=1622269 RepID=UPI00066FE401|nr:L-fucose:H+ symporter permease [Cellvibrio sp. pealriver]